MTTEHIHPDIEKLNSGTVTETDKKTGLFDFFKNSKMTFEGRKDGEKVIVFTRRHWITMANICIGSALASLLPLVVIVLGASYIIAYDASTWVALLWIAYEMCIWFALFYRLTMHSLDVWIVTNERIVDSLQLGLFRRKVSELHLESIQDISVNTSGIIQSYFDFGHIEIQTGATAQRFAFEDVPHPIWVKDQIMETARSYELSRERLFIDQKKSTIGVEPVA